MSWEYLDQGFQILFGSAKSNANLRELQKCYQIKHNIYVWCKIPEFRLLSQTTTEKAELVLVLHGLDS